MTPEPIMLGEAGDQSDGYHTFNELYEHRYALFLNLMSLCPSISWVSALHADGTMFSESFIGGMNLPTGVITYHLPIRLWNIACDINGITVLDRAPEWDGHTSPDVVTRLNAWLKLSNLPRGETVTIIEGPLDPRAPKE